MAVKMADGVLGLPDPRWLPLALGFNYQLASYVHDSWLDGLPHAGLVRRLRDRPGANAGLSRYLRDVLLAGGQGPEDFSSPWLRLPLLDAEALERLCLYLGLTLRSSEICREIAGPRVRLLRHSLGDAAYAFAVKRAPFFGASPTFTFEPAVEDPRNRFAIIGARFCSGRVAAVDAGGARRMALKLPFAWSAELAESEQRPADDEHFPPLVNKLIKEIAPQWAPLFA